MHSWLLLHYKIPAEPSARRVYVWRKLKRLGAILLHDAIWVLPATPYTLEQFQWLAVEIGEMEGEALLWEARLTLSGQEERLAQQFLEQVNQVYRDILAALGQSEPDLNALARQYQQAVAKDYFHSEWGQRVREALISARGGEL